MHVNGDRPKHGKISRLTELKLSQFFVLKLGVFEFYNSKKRSKWTFLHGVIKNVFSLDSKDQRIRRHPYPFVRRGRSPSPPFIPNASPRFDLRVEGFVAKASVSSDDYSNFLLAPKRIHVRACPRKRCMAYPVHVSREYPKSATACSRCKWMSVSLSHTLRHPTVLYVYYACNKTCLLRSETSRP
jgi:hypothetical protein